jgi:alkylation response protein AidB-like acyl-CoA dehydrogenase
VAPITARGVAIVGPRTDGGRAAYAVALDDPTVTLRELSTAGLPGLVCAHLTLNGTRSEQVGPTLPIMARVRVLIAAAGVGLGLRALHEALAVARAAHLGAAGEQTVQGLLADSATDLEAARMMTWRAAAASELSLADASLAKLMATAGAQHAVARATQVVGAESFRRGHVVERLAQDVRALELFAGRTEALRAAVAEGWLQD